MMKYVIREKYTVMGLMLFFLLFAVGVSFSINSWDGAVEYAHIPTGDRRDPAAIREVFNVKNATGLQPVVVKRELVESTRIIKSPESVGIELGNFLVDTPSGKKTFACVTFDKVELRFESGDMAVAGEPSVMTVEGNCQLSDDYKQMATIWIPMSKVAKGPPKEMEFQVFEKNPVHLKLENMGSDWPGIWNLTKVRFYNSKTTNLQSVFDLSELDKRQNQTLNFSW